MGQLIFKHKKFFAVDLKEYQRLIFNKIIQKLSRYIFILYIIVYDSRYKKEKQPTVKNTYN